MLKFWIKTYDHESYDDECRSATGEGGVLTEELLLLATLCRDPLAMSTTYK